ncbi:ectonucleoside triphosphate diphosphohydrolase 1-like isoform X3 [Stegodyphus dumicola]|uniref:ectonucleoside triphosphate diphosphohydrolase 1-like isoform X3 n=1 Tax=Stegodyphus dumicola TaxID=202533 RepID=UPI0015AA2DFC|nr:ectonucleoside triphosphate diphosphohydrolase 1-like isoform X3 [Stegodyphus dumicola]
MTTVFICSQPMQVTLQPLTATDGSSVVVDTNQEATASSLISSYCTQKSIAYSSNLAIFDGKKRPLPSYSTLGSLGITNGQNLHIGYKENTVSLSDQWPLLVALAALVMGLIGIISMSLAYGLTGGRYPYDYGVVMDAGSSKTNTILYKWQANKHKGTGFVSQEDNCFAKGGIAKMDPMKLDPVINCAKKVTKHIDPPSLSRTPLFFASTAGMRLLNITNPKRADEILEQLSLHLNETGLSVKKIEIISGPDEGIYGWITANFLQNTLEREQKFDPWIPTTYGALDMGGASMQIAYALPEQNKTKVKSLQLYGQTHNVFSQSNLCFGRDEAARRYKFLLLKVQSKAILYDPCSPKGYNQTVQGSFFTEPCTHSAMKIEGLKEDTNYTFVGTSEYSYCQGNVSKLLDDDECKTMKFKECFKKLSGLPGDQKYLAFATYFYTTDFLNLTQSSLEDYEKDVKSFCEKSYDQVKKFANNEYVAQYCFNAQYIYEALVNGFGFQNSTWKNINFVGRIANKDVGWTLGYMINATNIIPAKSKTPRLVSSSALTVSLVIFVLMILATTVFLLHNYCKDKYSKVRYDKP